MSSMRWPQQTTRLVIADRAHRCRANMAAVAIALSAIGCASGPNPAPRPSPLFEGTARWAANIAQPLIAAFAADAAMYSISGMAVWRDGRLPPSIGTWSIVGWSPSRKEIVQVTVKFDGTTSTETRSDPRAPSHNGQPLPAGWADSPIVFAAAAPHLACGASYANLAVLNMASYAEAPNQVAWAINYDVGQNQIVSWNGAYIGPQGAPNQPCASNLKSKFLSTAACANHALSGVGYDIADPRWIYASDQNREVCAYKFFAALHMLGYNTQMGGAIHHFDRPHVLAWLAFLGRENLPQSSVVTPQAVRALDARLVTREAKLVQAAPTFPLYGRFAPLHPHDVSREWLSLIYALPFSVLPQNLQMSAAETVQCIHGQCVGFIGDANGTPLPVAQPRVDLATGYRYVAAYFDRNDPNDRLPSAAAHVITVLHEFGHYIDGRSYTPAPDLPTRGRVATQAFSSISYDLTQLQGDCAPRRTIDRRDWITKYAFAGGYLCPPGKAEIGEDWAESFAMYVAAGRRFRTAAQSNPTLQLKYAWLKTNVFQGREYDTDLIGDFHSGCNDVADAQQELPGHISCADNYVWDAELRIK